VIALAVAVLATATVTGPARAPGAAGYEIVVVEGGGALAGRLRFAGTPLPPATLRVNKNRELCGAEKPSEALVVGADGGVKGGVVLIDGVARGKKPTGEVVLDNAKCVFVPHVSAGMVGGRVRVRNSDAILHNTHGFLAGRTVFNLGLPDAGQVVDVTKRVTRVGVIRVLCDAHPHMSAWVVIHDSPYFAVTDEGGRYRIDGIPPGTYRVRMWHEGYRQTGTDKDGRVLYEDPLVLTREVTVPPGGSVTMDFELR
jgi:hypothetical protein